MASRGFDPFFVVALRKCAARAVGVSVAKEVGTAAMADLCMASTSSSSLCGTHKLHVTVMIIKCSKLHRRNLYKSLCGSWARVLRASARIATSMNGER